MTERKSDEQIAEELVKRISDTDTGCSCDSFTCEHWQGEAVKHAAAALADRADISTQALETVRQKGIEAAVDYLERMNGYEAAASVRKALIPTSVQDVAWACVWEADREGVYQTACGHAYRFTIGGVSDYEVEYCCYCGKPISELRYQEAQREK